MTEYTLEQKELWMRRALELARQAWGQTHPNPMVGAVLVEEGRIVAEGWHAAAGQPHAEIRCLEALGRAPAPGATLVVTLEPCCTQGRTGACTAAILAAGIRQVIVGATDPNPLHAGRGFRVLEEAGVRVEPGLLADECTDLNLIFNHWIVHGKPCFAGKAALTLDGKIATRMGESKWITSEAARADVMRWRRLFPAIAVGGQTVLSDDPSLTARLPEGAWCPVRFIIDGLLRTVNSGQLPRVYADEYRDRTIVVCSDQAGSGYVRKLEAAGVRVWRFPTGSTTRVPYGEFRWRCAAEGITGVLFEGGSRVLSGLVHSREMDYLLAYQAPVLFADERAKAMFRGLRTEKIAQAVRLSGVRRSALGDDTLVRGFVHYPDYLSADETIFGHG